MQQMVYNFNIFFGGLSRKSFIFNSLNSNHIRNHLGFHGPNPNGQTITKYVEIYKICHFGVLAFKFSAKLSLFEGLAHLTHRHSWGHFRSCQKGTKMDKSGPPAERDTHWWDS